MNSTRFRVRKLVWLCLIPILAVTCFYGAKHLTIGIKAYGQIQASPFVLEIDYYTFEKNPQGELIERRITARRSDGSTAVVTFLPAHSGISARSVTFLNGAHINALDFIAAKTSWKMGSADLAALKERLANPPPNCTVRRDTNFVGNDSLAEKTVTKVELIEDGSRTTRWLARELGCEQLQFRFETKQPDGTYKLAAEARLASLKLQEPEAGFFDPSANFEEVRPSEALRRTIEKLGATPPQDLKSQGERLDKSYVEHQ